MVGDDHIVALSESAVGRVKAAKEAIGHFNFTISCQIICNEPVWVMNTSNYNCGERGVRTATSVEYIVCRIERERERERDRKKERKRFASPSSSY